ncbi:MAG: hydrogen gas-evolving membrane-bound hydrogenase subunit E [Suilimivivens sp.]
MSKLKSQDEYEKTRAFRFFRWLSGSKDPYLGEVEMQPQKEWTVEEATIQERMQEKQMIMDKVYDVKHNNQLVFFHKVYAIGAILFCIALAGLLLYTVSYLPATGEADKPVNNEVPARYIESGLQETGAVNIVTGMILDYRAFDTFGESNVLFVATITVLILLHINKKKDENGKEEEPENDRIYEPKNDAILQAAAKVLVPTIILFGIYVILNGHLSPGGGFSGGAIIGAGLILYLNAFGFQKTEKLFTEKTYKWISFAALTTYCLAKSYSFYTGANHLESHIPLGTPGHILSSGLILILNICVGMVVACTMYTFYVMFRKGDF